MRRGSRVLAGKYRIFLTMAAMLAAALACNAPWVRHGVSNIRMTTDSSGKTTTSVYATDASFFLYADLNGLTANQVVEARWYAVNAEGIVLNSDINRSTYEYQPGITQVYFRLDPSGGPWPTGSYRVDVYLDGMQVGEQAFTVQ
jgi:hypothetical protein